MNRTMTKNICLVAAFFITAILAVLMMGNNAGATASAASADFEFVLREVEEPNDESALDADQIALFNEEGEYYALEWKIEYSERAYEVTAGATIEYDSDNFALIADGEEFLYAPGLGFTYYGGYDVPTHTLAITAANGSSTTGGRFITIYFEKISNSTAATMPVVSIYIDKLDSKTDSGREPIDIPVPHDTDAYFALLGDIDGNGVVDADDAMALLQAMSGVSTITEAQWATNSGRFPNVVCFAQADANHDDVISSADANEILDYYSHILIGNYDGSVGNYIVYYA